MLRLHVLHRLPVAPEDIHADNRLSELRVGALNEVVIDVLLVAESVEPFEDELEERTEVLGRRGSDEDVCVAKAERARDSEAEGSGLQASGGSGGRCGREVTNESGGDQRGVCARK